MNFESRRAIRGAIGAMVLCLLGTAGARGQAPAAAANQKPQMSEEAFKNVQVLRGIPVNEFMGTMGFFAASLGLNCTDCHVTESASDWKRYADDTPLKQTARRMVLMENLINRSDFGATQLVTCYTCHRGYQKPDVIPSLAEQNAAPPPQDPDKVDLLPNAPANPSAAEQLVDKFIQAIGGTQKLSQLNSFVAKGTYSGFDTDFQKAPVEISAKSPNLRSMTVHLTGGDTTSTFDGNEAWVTGAAPYRPVPFLLLTGGDLDGARLDAQLSFPAMLKQDLSKWRVGFPDITIDDQPVQIVQATAPGGTLVKLYFDKKTGLLVRQVRLIETVVGLTPLHVEYSDYRAVGGTKMPFHMVVTWVDGQSTIELTNIEANAAVGGAKFAKPAMTSAQGAASK